MVHIRFTMGRLVTSLMWGGLMLLAAFPAQNVLAQDLIEPQLRGCATPLEMQRQIARSQRGGSALLGEAASITRVQAVTLRARTYLTSHIAVHYTLAPSVNRPRWALEFSSDSILKAKVDSLLLVIPTGNTTTRDSTLHAKLDSLEAGHPQYVLKAGEYFERAWQYYDSLGMRMPDSSRSRFFNVAVQGRVAVDIADIGTVSFSPKYNGPYYGLAYQPENGEEATILLENDFLYSARYVDSIGQSAGTPITAPFNGQTYRDYSVSWDMGLKVTASHEFYHIVQYEYTPVLDLIHAWYELSATAMEERLAPEVNDYFQYLPYNIPRNHDISLSTQGTLANYGNAIFHTYLTRVLGAGFDRAVWESLDSSNNMPAALVKMAGSQARWDSLYMGYAAAMSLSGTPGATSSPLAFSPDMALWPSPRFDTIPTSTTTSFNVPALTYRLVRPAAAGPGIAAFETFRDPIRVDSTSSGYQFTQLTGSAADVAKGSGSTRTQFTAANGSFSTAGTLVLTKRGSNWVIVKNPLSRAKGALVALAPSGGATDSLRIVSESGRHVATRPANASGAFWDWNLKDAGGQVVPPGIYHVRRGGETPRPVLILP